MATEKFMFVALPNGSTGHGRLRLSVYFAPRLDDGAQLADFPDLLHWTRIIHDHGLDFTFGCNGQSITVPITRPALRPDIWQHIFSPSAMVSPYRIPPYHENLIVSYPSRQALEFVKYAYQTISLQPAQGEIGKRILGTVLRDLGFRGQRGESTLDSTLELVRGEMWKQQLEVMNRGGRVRGPFTRAGAPKSLTSLPPDGVPTTLSTPPQNRDTISRFALFHNMPAAAHRGPLPSSEADFAKLMDFHQALACIHSYPPLMRALGLVFDLEIPDSFCPASPGTAGGSYLDLAITDVKTGANWSIAPQFVFPKVSFWRDELTFSAAPATPSADVANQAYVMGDIVHGLLTLVPDLFHLAGVDLDGALLKALTLADNVARRSSAEIENVLPSLRSAGIALMADGRAWQLLESILENQQFDVALQNNAPMPRSFNARDLVRGYRLDIWTSQTGRWHSLHRRNGTYRFGRQNTIVLKTTDEEGFIQFAAAQPADDPEETIPPSPAPGVPSPRKDIFVHERVASWSGWSLSASRPGAALNRSPDPDLATAPDPTVNQAKTPFKMSAQFEAFPHSLPHLRFGGRYRMRARAVDLAGNSLPVQHVSASDLVLPPDADFPYLRFEPVPHPVLMLRTQLKPGASLDRLVIRSYNSDAGLDSVPSLERDERHVVPAKAAVRLVEQHGMLDDAQGHLRGDRATYNEIIRRDKGELASQGNVPIDPQPKIKLPYFPDPLARGAAFHGLPHAPDNSAGEIGSGQLVYSQTQQAPARNTSTTHIDFGTGWPDPLPFRLCIHEGAAAPTWDPAQRILTVFLTKSEMTDVPLSSYLNGTDLPVMGIWNWIRELMEYLSTSEMQNANAGQSVPWTAEAFASLTQRILDGGHPMLTPEKTLTLVHAVQQPIGIPEFVPLPIVHDPGQVVLASALGNQFSPMTAWRSLHSHHAFLLGALRIHGSSTTKIDLEARWNEFVDDVTKPAPTIHPSSDHVDSIDVSSLAGGLIAGDPAASRYVAVYLPEVDTLWFAAPFDSLPGVQPPFAVAAPMHRFPDTKHRLITYSATATSRFREYFPPNLKFTRTSYPLVVEVPSSSRPVAPEILYVVPTFGYDRQESSNVKTEVRLGNGVRVYVHRPWYSSGQGELLGVTLWPSTLPAPSTSDREKYKHQITQWGLDPIWKSGPVPEMPGINHFPQAVAVASGLTLENSALNVDVAGHEVVFDRTRNLWYCDITFQNPSAYMPFVRLALARYQPFSIPGAELSQVQLTSYVQLAPDRSAVLSVDPSDPRRARVYVGGIAPDGPTKSFFTVTVEKRIPQIVSDLAWQTAPSTEVLVEEDVPAPNQPDAILWSGIINFSQSPLAGIFRVVVRENEVLPRDPGPSDPTNVFGSRIVYASIIPYDFSSAGRR